MNHSLTYLLSYLTDRRPAGSQLTGRLEELIRRGYPPQYLIGRVEFMGLDLIITPGVFIPRPETELLIEHILNENGYRFGLEIGVGSGAIMVALLTRLPHLFMVGTEISPVALEVCRANLLHHQLRDRAMLILSPHLDIFSPQSFDLVVANPPYIPTGELSHLPRRVRFEPRSALDGGEDGAVLIRDILTKAPILLRPGGLLALEIDPGIEIPSSTLREIRIYPDYSGDDRILIGRR